MATAEELLGTISDITDEFLVVDLDTRIISIPARIKVLGVESDDDVKQVRFKVPRNYGEFDLSTFSVQVNFMNARGEGDFYSVRDIEVLDDGTMTFAWLVDRHAFVSKGDVEFSLCMKKFDTEGVVVKELNTTIATLPVLEGLETTEAVVENNASAFDSVLFRLYAVEAATGNSTNGYYTIASVNETDDDVEFSIFGSDGLSVATIKKPKRGIDYWTEDDKTEIKNHVDTWGPMAATVILSVGSWDSATNTQTATINEMNPDHLVIIAPHTDIGNIDLYESHGIRGIEQGNGYLIFECSTIPESDIIAYVGMFNIPAVAGNS